MYEEDSVELASLWRSGKGLTSTLFRSPLDLNLMIGRFSIQEFAVVCRKLSYLVLELSVTAERWSMRSVFGKQVVVSFGSAAKISAQRMKDACPADVALGRSIVSTSIL